MKKNGIVSGIFWSFGERIVAQLVSFAVSIILARILTPDDYGVIAILLIFITLADVFVSNGFGTALIQDKNADKDDFSTIFYCSLIVSIIIYVILFISAPIIAKFYNNNNITLLMRVLAIRIPISSYNTVQRAYISRNMMFQKFFLITLIGTTASAVIGIALAYNGAGAWALIAQYLSNTIIDSITLSIIVDWKPQLVFNRIRAKKLMSFGWKVLAAELIGTFFDQIQSLTIGKVFTSSDLAYYNKGNQIPSMISSNVSNSVMTVLFPAIANKDGNYEEIKVMSRKSIRMMIYIVFPLMIGLAMVSSPLIIILLTVKWQQSIKYMSILSIAVAFTLVGNTGLQTIKAVGRSDLLLKIELYKKPVFLLMLFISSHIGVEAVAISACLYSFYAMIINFGTMGKIINYTFSEQIKDIWSVGKLSLMMCLFILPINLIKIENNWCELILKVVIGGGSYWLLSVVTKSKEYVYICNTVKSKLIR